MKRLLILGALIFGLASASYSENRDLFSINEDQIFTEMSDLIELENYLATNMTSLSDLISSNNVLVANISTSSTGLMSIANFGEPPLGIPSFLWGFCLGVPGLAIVYFVAEDKAETKKALWGCIVGTAISTIVYVIYVAAVVSETSTTTTY